MPVVLPLVTLLLLWVALGQLSGLVYPFISTLIVTMSPPSRSQFQLIYAMLPALIASMISLMVFTPLVGGVNFSGHCHGLVCSDHVPVLQTTSLIGTGLISFFGISVAVTVLFLAFSVWRNFRAASILCRLSSDGVGDQYRILETKDIVACCVGLFRSEILISRGILEKASQLQLQVILNHERAHACRLDNLRKLLVTLATLTWSRSGRGRLLADVDLACEQGCDRVVAGLEGSAKIVADTITLVNSWQGSVLSSMDREQAMARLALLNGHDYQNEEVWKPVAMVFSSSAALTVIAGDMLHQAAEVILTFVPY